MLNRSLLKLNLYIQPLETCLFMSVNFMSCQFVQICRSFSCPSFSAPPSLYDKLLKEVRAVIWRAPYTAIYRPCWLRWHRESRCGSAAVHRSVPRVGRPRRTTPCCRRRRRVKTRERSRLIDDASPGTRDYRPCREYQPTQSVNSGVEKCPATDPPEFSGVANWVFNTMKQTWSKCIEYTRARRVL